MGRTVYRFSAEKDADQILLWLSGCCPGCVKVWELSLMEKVFHIVLSLIRLTLHLIERYLNTLSPVLCFGCLNSPAPSKIGKPKLMTVLNMYVSL